MRQRLSLQKKHKPPWLYSFTQSQKEKGKYRELTQNKTTTRTGTHTDVREGDETIITVNKLGKEHTHTHTHARTHALSLIHI